MASDEMEQTYTVFIRLPFPRGSFVDPPPMNWNSAKDEALWNIISEVSKTEIDWHEIATRFQVTVDFLLQQVAFLTERHASQVRAQMRKAQAAAKGSSAPSPVQGTETPLSSEAMQRTGSGGGRPRAPSSLSIRRDSPLPRNDGSIPGTPMRGTPRPGVTRNSSSNTAVYGTRNLGGSTSKGASRATTDSQRRRLQSLPISTSVPDPDPEQEADPPSPGPADTSSAASSSESSPAQSRIIRRPPKFRATDAASPYADEDEDEDDEPAFLQKRPQNDGSTSGQHDLSATLRGTLRENPPRRPVKGRFHHSHTSDSSTSSTAQGSKATAGDSSKSGGPLSPRRAMEAVVRSPGVKGKGYSRDSDGTPSMGSSFSDLDDASVTQSALEEALASKMQDGGTMGSRISTISNVFRSRYLPKSGGNNSNNNN